MNIFESVFALSFKENVEVFGSKGWTNSTHSLYICLWCAHINRISYIGVGHCIVYFTSGIPQPSLR